jgi:hypothetical protein
MELGDGTRRVGWGRHDNIEDKWGWRRRHAKGIVGAQQQYAKDWSIRISGRSVWARISAIKWSSPVAKLYNA